MQNEQNFEGQQTPSTEGKVLLSSNGIVTMVPQILQCQPEGQTINFVVDGGLVGKRLCCDAVAGTLRTRLATVASHTIHN